MGIGGMAYGEADTDEERFKVCLIRSLLTSPQLKRQFFRSSIASMSWGAPIGTLRPFVS